MCVKTLKSFVLMVRRKEHEQKKKKRRVTWTIYSVIYTYTMKVQKELYIFASIPEDTAHK